MVSVVLSEGERRFVLEGVRAGVRTDGRGLRELQPMAVSMGTLPQANGSARVRGASCGSDVLAAVKAELGEPVGGSGEVRTSVSFWASATPAFARRETAAAADALTEALQAVLMSPGVLDLEALVVSPGALAWRLFVDVTVFSAGGSLLSAVCLAASLALHDAILPALGVATAAESGALDVRVVDDVAAHVRVSDVVARKGAHLPLLVTAALVGGEAVVDPTAQEEVVADAVVHVGVLADGTVCSLRSARAGGALPLAAAAARAGGSEDEEGEGAVGEGGPGDESAVAASVPMAHVMLCVDLAAKVAPELSKLLHAAHRAE
jgi:exosome complex component RRP42